MLAIKNFFNGISLQKLLALISIVVIVSFSSMFLPLTIAFMIILVPLCVVALLIFLSAKLAFLAKQKIIPSTQGKKSGIWKNTLQFMKNKYQKCLSFLTETYDKIFGEKFNKHETFLIQANKFPKIFEASDNLNLRSQNKYDELQKRLRQSEEEITKICQNLESVKQKNIVLQRQNDTLRSFLTEKYRIIEENGLRQQNLINDLKALEIKYQILSQQIKIQEEENIKLSAQIQLKNNSIINEPEHKVKISQNNSQNQQRANE